MKIFGTVLILFIGLTFNSSATSSLTINGLPPTLQVGDTLFVNASGGIGPYSWMSYNPGSITVTQLDSNKAQIIVLSPALNVSIQIQDIFLNMGNQIVHAYDFMTRIGNASFIHGDTVFVPIYYSNKKNDVGLLSADIHLPYDTTVFKFIGFEKTGTLTNSMFISSNQVYDTIKFGIAGGIPISITTEQVFLMLRFVSKIPVVSSVIRPLHFTQFIVNETINGAFIDGSLTVDPIPNRPPVFPPVFPDTLYLLENQNFSFTMHATDPDGDSLTYYLNPLLLGMTVDSNSGVLQWTPNYNQAGMYGITMNAKDSLGLFDSKFVVFIVININRPPTYTTVLSDTTIAENQFLSFNYNAVDPDLDVLSYFFIKPVGGMSLSVSGNLQWQPSYTQAGIETVIVMVSDGLGGILLDSAIITVTNVNNPPIFTAFLPDTSIARFDTLRFHYSGIDPDLQAVTFSLQSFPPGATISPTGDLQWSPPIGANGLYNFVVQLTDGMSTVNDTVFIKVVRFGDVSENGTITSFDAGLILRDQVGAIVLKPVQVRVGNVSGDSSITSMDASLILQYVVGLINTFPGGLGKQSQQNAEVSAFSFKIIPSQIVGDYDLFVSVNRPSQVFGITMCLRFDSSLVVPKAMKQTELTDSMSMSYFFPKGKANLALAGIKPLNTVGNIAKFSFTLKDPNIAHNAILFTMDKFVLNEKDFAGEIAGIPLSVEEAVAIPSVYALSQNYPNPFNPTTTIKYQLPNNSRVTVSVYNLLGQLMTTLVNDEQSAGYHSIQWNGTDSYNKSVSSGVYLYKIIAQSQGKNTFVDTKKMMLLK